MVENQYLGVIFDFNGVLLWDNHLHEEAWRRFSERLRGWPLSDEEMKLAVHGRVNRDIFEYVLGRTVGITELGPLAEEKEAIYRRLALEEGESYRLSPGAVELLDFLAARGIPRAIATSSPWVNVAFFIEQLELLRWFSVDHIIHDNGRYPGKPAPDIYLEVAARLGGDASGFVVVEDSVAGVKSAYHAGIGAIIGIGPVEAQAELGRYPGVRTVITTLSEFPRELLVINPIEDFV